MYELMERLFLITIVVIIFVHTATIHAADTTIRYKDQPPPSAIAPSLSIGSGSDVCIVVRTGAIGTGLFSGSFATHVIDKNCERIKLSRSLAQLGLKVSATSILCQDDRVFTAMLAAGSPCPIDGLVGKEAKAKYLELGIIDENNNIVGPRGSIHVHINSSGRNYYGQPTK